MANDGVLVSASGFLTDQPGGAQACTREYIATLRAAGVNLHLCPYKLDRRLSTRVLKKLWPSSYFRLTEQGLIEKVLMTVKRNNAQFVFLNQVQLALMAAPLRAALKSDCKIVALSHGLESTDLLHALRLKRDMPFAIPKYYMGKQLLGDTLLRECSYRSNLDLVLCLSPFDVELERWMGARKVEWLPRIVTPDPLIWNPSGDRMGFVGTLDHAPTIEGLLLFLRSLSEIVRASVRVRIVGGPDRIGQFLMNSFPIVDYLGALSDDDLKQEASTWKCFVHPIFCYPRGCSTKLATAIGWQIPIVTTSSGQRGYSWGRGALFVSDSPRGFSDLALKMMDIEIARQARAQVSDIAHSSPTIASVGQKIALLLGIN